MVDDPLIGRTLANFRIEQVVGRGGMAVVYLGTDIRLERPVAIKVIDKKHQENPEYAERFIAEAKLVARWQHPNIISVYYAGEQDGLSYFVMEYIDGATLEDLLFEYLSDGELMPYDDVVKIGYAVARGLDYAHSKDVVHRDVKPSNIMISRDDRVVLTDFGLALDMEAGSLGLIFGTPHYVSPEQVQLSSSAVPQSDVYSLGVVLYEILTGALPFDDPNPTELALKHITDIPPSPKQINPALTHATEQVLLRALSKDADDRYPTAHAMIEALEIALTDNASAPIDDEPSDILLPAQVRPPQAQRPALSRTSISDMVMRDLAQTADVTVKRLPRVDVTQQSAVYQAPPPMIPATVDNPPTKAKRLPPKASQANLMKLILGVGALLMVIVIGGGLFYLFGGGNNNEATLIDPVETQSVTNTPIDTATPNESDDNAITGTIAAIEATNAVIATANANALRATANALQTGNAPVIEASTQVFPNGRLIEMTYNSAGFYLRNTSSTTIAVRQLAFQAIGNNGDGASLPFDGATWAAQYSTVDANGRCVGIELNDQPQWTRPTNCVASGGFTFNALLNFPTDDSRIFWTSRNSAMAFIVFWDGREIARCPIATGMCQVRVGN